MKKLGRCISASLAVFGAFGMAQAAYAQGCPRESLQKMADDYVVAQEEANVLGKLPVGEWMVIRENFKMSSISGGLLGKKLDVAWHLSLVDPQQCRVFVEAVILEPEQYVTATTFNNGYFGVSEINTVISGKNDWLFDAQKTYEYARREDWGVLPEAQRGTRDELIAAANAYLDHFDDKSVVVPWGTPCRRLEGGVYTGKGQPDDSCDVGVPEGIKLVNRSYIVDVDKGAVAVFLRFGGEDGPADVHTFRVINGKITNVHTVTNCGDKVNCGFKPLSEMLKENPAMQPDPALFGEPRD